MLLKNKFQSILLILYKQEQLRMEQPTKTTKIMNEYKILNVFYIIYSYLL